MKTALLITLFAGSFAFAAQPQFTAQVSPVDQDIKAVRLMDSGDLQVENYSGAINTIKLDEQNFNSMNFIATDLNKVPLTTDQHAVICMIVVPFWMHNVLSVRNEKGTDMFTVLSAQSCAISSFTHPKNQNDLTDAQILKAELMLLARQYAPAK